MKQNWIKCKMCGDAWAESIPSNQLFDTSYEYCQHTVASISKTGLCTECTTS